MKKNTIFKYCASLALGLALTSNLCASWTEQIIAGTLGSTGWDSGDGGSATRSTLSYPYGVAVDYATPPNVYIADVNYGLIRKVDGLTGNISTVAGGLGCWNSGTGNGTSAVGARIGVPLGIGVDKSGNLYLADSWNNVIRMVTASTGIISTIAGGDGSLRMPTGMFIDDATPPNIYFSDSGNNCIKKFTVGGAMSVVWSSGLHLNVMEGTAFHSGGGDVCADSNGNVYIADTGNNCIKKLTGGVITTILSSGLSYPSGIWCDTSGKIYIADTGNSCVKMLETNGNVTTIASGLSLASFTGPTDEIGVDSLGNVYVADITRNVVRKLLPTSLTIEVDGAASATVSATLTATTVHKNGAGTAVLSGDNSSVSTLEIDAGLVQVSATNNMGASLAFAGGNMEVTSGTVAVPTAAMNQAGTITTDASAAVSSIAAPYGTSVLTLAGSGVVTAGDMSTSSTPLFIPGVMHVGASSSSKMPTGVATVPSGGLVKIMGATASSVPGATQLQSGAVLEVANSVTVPAHTGADIFGTLKFDSGSSLKLGASSSWARNITVGTAL